MNGIEMIKGRRSVRNFKDKKIDRKELEEIVEVARYAPSWANFQIARYTFVDSEKLIKEITDNGVHKFGYNMDTLKRAKAILVLSFVKGKSGKLNETDYATNKGNEWEVFDAGIACQTFCLAAHEKGIGTCIFGVIDDKRIAQIVKLPEDETVASIIALGYPEAETPATPRKSANEIMRFAD